MTSKLIPTHDQAIVIPRPDLHAEALGVWDAGCNGFIETKEFGAVRVDCPVRYTIPAARNTFGFVQVDSWGQGTIRGAGMDKPDVEVGDIVGIDLCQVGHTVAHAGKEKWFIPWKEFLCKFNPKDLINPTPLMNYVMTEYSEEMMNHLAFKGGTGLIAPGVTHAKGLKTNSNPNTNIRIAVEKVLGVGTGRFVKKVWTEPGCKEGQGVVFMPFQGTVHLQIGAARRAFTPWSEVEAVLEID